MVVAVSVDGGLDEAVAGGVDVGAVPGEKEGFFDLVANLFPCN